MRLSRPLFGALFTLVSLSLPAAAEAATVNAAVAANFTKVATDLGTEVKTAADVTRSTKPNGDLTAAAIQGTFSGPKGTAAVAAGAADQTKVVLVVTASDVPPYFSGAPEMDQAKTQLADQISNDFLVQYMTQLQAQLGVSVNQAALAQAIGVSQPGS